MLVEDLYALEDVLGSKVIEFEVEGKFVSNLAQADAYATHTLDGMNFENAHSWGIVESSISWYWKENSALQYPFLFWIHC